MGKLLCRLGFHDTHNLLYYGPYIGWLGVVVECKRPHCER